MQTVSAFKYNHYSQLLHKQQLGLRNQQGQFSAAPVSLTPWHLSAKLWQQAQDYSKLLSRLLWAVSRDLPWLKSQLTGLANGSLLAKLVSQPGVFGEYSQALPIMRHDFLLDRHGQWRWVESNTIAAGMGPLNQQLAQLLSPDFPALASNPAIAAQASALFQAALSVRWRHPGAKPVVVFVVEPQEDNIFDQLLLQQALVQHGAIVHRYTLQQLAQARLTPRYRLQLDSGDEADLLYYRTGYNLTDYASEAELALRGRLQHMDLVQCPDLPLQLAGSKWIQASLSRLLLTDAIENLQRWGLSRFEQQQLRQIVMPVHALSQMAPAHVQRCIDAGWILKSQQEGGGGVWRGAEAAQQLHADTAASDSWLLMAPVDTYIRTEPVTLLRETALLCQHATVSELGIFTVSSKHHYGGYLLRSKPAAQLAGGVHRGTAVLDTVVLY